MIVRSRLAATVAVALGSGVLAASAPALPSDLRSPDAVDAASATAQDLRSPDAAEAADAAEVAPPGVAVVGPSATPSPGFEWGSAAIGAAGAMGLVAVAVGGGMTVRRRRPAGSPQ